MPRQIVEPEQMRTRFLGRPSVYFLVPALVVVAVVVAAVIY